MTPSEYIASLKADTPPVAVEESNLPDWLKEQWIESGQDIGELLESVNKSDWAQNLLDYIKPRFDPAFRSLIDSDLIAIGTVGNPSPDVYVKKLDKGYAIVFHAGLKDFIYRVARAIATRFRARGREYDTLTGDGLQETARLIAEIFWWYQETGHASGPQYPIDKDQIRIANLLAVESESFLIAHEIGHIIADAIDSDSLPLIDLPEQASPSQRDEYTADFLGLQLALELNSGSPKLVEFNAPLRYAAAEFALQIFRGLEELGFDFHDSHPAAGLRIEFIRREMQRRCADDNSWRHLSSLALAIDSLFSRIIQIIAEPGEHAEFFESSANRIVSELDQALDRCTGGMVPNYVGFYSQATEIFARGYSHAMLERVAQIAADFFTDAHARVDGKLEHSHASWVRFQKFKLLFGYIYQYLNEPARTTFIEAFGRFER